MESNCDLDGKKHEGTQHHEMECDCNFVAIQFHKSKLSPSLEL